MAGKTGGGEKAPKVFVVKQFDLTFALNRW